MLRRIGRLARTPDDPLVLSFDQRGVEAFDGFLAGLHADRRRTEGLEAAWLGKGWSTVARLAGALELLAWSGTDAPGLPGHIGREQVEAAAALWTGYFRPHARAVFDRAAPSDFDASGKAGGALAQGRRRDGGVARGRQAQGARPGGECRATPTWCSTVSHFLGFVRPDRCDDQRRTRSSGKPLAGQSGAEGP